MLRPLLVSLRQLILPAHCAACGGPAAPDGRAPLCGTCGQALAELIEAPYCLRCGRHAGPHTMDERGCIFCRNYPIRHDATVRLGRYEGPLKRLILGCKYERRPHLAPVLGRLLAERLALAPWADTVEAVVPVPLHWTRHAKRGYNQAEMLARSLVAAGGLGTGPTRAGRGPRVVRHLRRTRATQHQARLHSSDRQESVRGAFEVRRGAADLKGKTVLLVDDVMTSGTTVAECTRVLKAGGASAVYVAVVATADYDEPGVW
jgi:ComF family protein